MVGKGILAKLLYLKSMESADVRDKIIEQLRSDVLGPNINIQTGAVDLHETLAIGGSPDRFYMVGKLMPIMQGDAQLPESMNQQPILSEDHDANLEEETLVNSTASAPDAGQFMQPSSMGITVCPKKKESSLTLTISWGRYEKIDDIWHRRTHQKVFNFDTNMFRYNMRHEVIEIDSQMELHVRRGAEKHATLTFRLRNILVHQPPKNRGHFVIFQPRIEITSTSGWKDVRQAQDPIREDKKMSILYSDSEVFGLGHNVGVDWNADGLVWSDYLPTYDMKKMLEDKKLRDLVPNMDLMCDDAKFAEGTKLLWGFLEAYEQWINRSESDLKNRFQGGYISQHLEPESISMVMTARENLRRMKDGVEYLSKNDFARRAFIMANQSIRMSQDEPTHPDLRGRGQNFKWRPFQLAFQLLNIRSLCALEQADPGREERNMMDLAWFPTGGGKTEAYLGMIATIGFYRRLRFPDTERQRPSVHAVMRYTLRLLTSDQADRLVRLAGAMNHVAEQNNPKHGFHEFRIGMWIGGAASPNRLLAGQNDQDPSAEGNLRLLRNNMPEKGSGTVLQFELCPWCGDDSDAGVKSPSNWKIADLNGQKSLLGTCPIETCLFHEGIPFTCIDDDLYLNPPSILLGTADKFAQLSRNPIPRSVYGRNTPQARVYNARTMLGFDDRHFAPDLIIQDELHLLTGPLGTIAGLIETAMDVSWGSVGHQPKYVAATATIRGAERDAMLMYGRELNVFPPPVATASDNFFAQMDRNEKNGRKHVAIMGPPGVSRTMFSQPTASLIQRLHELRIKNPSTPDNVFDPYFTLVGYFNSLRELGGAQTMLADRVAREFIAGRYAQRGGVTPREISNLKELTSRRTASELKSVKASLAREIGDEPVDAVVTTNMFQVGIDISRLGLMVITGQPKSNSEYIQSSGRVGRRYPGLVVSLLRGTYPRDLSHFENFREFHQEVYRHVDVTSTTPFSQRALDRGMATAICIMFRMCFEQLSSDRGLSRLFQSQVQQDRCLQLLTEFTRKIEQRESNPNVNTPVDIVQEAVRTAESNFQNLKQFCMRCIDDDKTAVWNEPFYHSEHELGWLKPSSDGSLSTKYGLNSFRDVAPEVRIIERRRMEHGINNQYIPEPETLPASHLLAQAAPGNLWEKDGKTNLTLGLNQWYNGEGNISLRPQREGGQVITRDALSHLLPANTKLRHLPTHHIHGAVLYDRYPSSNAYRCKVGHISTPRRDDDGWQCGRQGCDEVATPTRFVSICSRGHLQVFDYYSWLHDTDGKRTQCTKTNASIRLSYGNDASHTLKDWILECDSCNVPRKNMAAVPTITEENGPQCNGSQYWIDWDRREACDHNLIHRQVGSTNVTFNDGGSILLIPLSVTYRYADQLREFGLMNFATKEHRTIFFNVLDAVKPAVTAILSESDCVADGELDSEFLFETLCEYNREHTQAEGLTIGTIRKKEKMGLLNPEVASRFDPNEYFGRSILTDTTGYWSDAKCPVDFVTRADRLTELRYITGFTRVDPNADHKQHIDDMNHGERHGIAQTNHGEGIFFRLKPAWIHAIADERNRTLSVNHSTMLPSLERIRSTTSAQLPSVSESGAQGANHLTIIHTLSHALIREICKSAGYSSGSINERLYLQHNAQNQISSAGILLYTAGASSDGTLGGLVRQATSAQLELVIQRALASLETCSNDPVCYHHEPNGNERNGAACHACLYLPETSCELGNLFLDRRWSGD
tara:strand:+ start:653 stop:5827 length:5175 start_codon:yes stop_codon:yes gene_type:complete